MRKRALLSLSDKSGIKELAHALDLANYEIIASGGTSKELERFGIAHREISDVTGFAELISGRVKTLHPVIFASILADRERDLEEIQALGAAPIDLIAVNLYPFTESPSIENIDIGGAALIRAGAKNYQSVTTLTRPDQYPEFIDSLPTGLSLERRRELAATAFALTMRYDLAISHFLTVKNLRYGENPHQSGALLASPFTDSSVATATVISGSKEISYNNYIDSDAAIRAVYDHSECAVAIVKHQNPCGIAVGKSPLAAFKKALESDPVSSFGGVVGVNREVDEDLAKDLSEIFLEVVIAPYFSSGAVEILRERSNLRLLALGSDSYQQSPENLSAHFISGGILVESRDEIRGESSADWELVAGGAVTGQLLEDLEFAWRTIRSVKSNAIVIAKSGATVGIGMGQVSRVDAAKLAIMKSGGRCQGAVAASDGFFPFADGALELVSAGVRAIVAPRGSKRDSEVIGEIAKAGATLYFADKRHFSH